MSCKNYSRVYCFKMCWGNMNMPCLKKDYGIYRLFNLVSSSIDLCI